MCVVKGALFQGVTAFFGQNSANIMTKYVYSHKNALHEDASKLSKENYIVMITSLWEFQTFQNRKRLHL